MLIFNNAANYVQWRFVHILSSATTQEMWDLRLVFNQALHGTTTSPPIACADTVNDLLGFAVSKKYIETISKESQIYVINTIWIQPFELDIFIFPKCMQLLSFLL